VSLGQRICQYRTRRGMSQLELAERLEVSRQSISKWETDVSTPELEKLVKMCEVFEVTLDELVRGIQPPEPQPDAPPQPQPVVVQKTPARFIVGGVLLLCGLLIFVQLWLFRQEDILTSILFASIIAAPGIAALKVEESTFGACLLAEMLVWAVMYPLFHGIAAIIY